mmetsp:Transcript_8732/g.35647  ORF Transcript_8732/g.35647 Transcript_8732/m.35647 type:complete len:304 (-) Transcript_8732:4774-5685(-)
MFAQERGRVVQQHQQHAQHAAVHHAHGLRQLGGAEGGLHESQRGHDEALEQIPARAIRQHLGHVRAVRDELEPGERERWHTQRLDGHVELCKRGQRVGAPGLAFHAINRRREVSGPRHQQPEVRPRVEARTLLVRVRHQRARGNAEDLGEHGRRALRGDLRRRRRLAGSRLPGPLNHVERQFGERVHRLEVQASRCALRSRAAGRGLAAGDAVRRAQLHEDEEEALGGLVATRKPRRLQLRNERGGRAAARLVHPRPLLEERHRLLAEARAVAAALVACCRRRTRDGAGSSRAARPAPARAPA